MLTPIELKEKMFKSGMGYNKKDVDLFFENVTYDYENIYKKNIELKEKISVLSEGIQYYKNLETTLQKTLVLAEKTANEITLAATTKAEAIEQEARIKADGILENARKEMITAESKINALLQQFESYKAQFKQMLTTQSNLLDSETFTLKKEKLIPLNHIESSSIVSPKPVQENKENREVINRKPEEVVKRSNINIEAREKEAIKRPIVPNLKREEPPKREGFISKTERAFRQQGKLVKQMKSTQSNENRKAEAEIEKEMDEFNKQILKYEKKENN